ncbi:MAG: hypothetical protein IJH34_02490 [Romboutsia sp.]|nr:hypothetical protein [Romboutsia sp.]MBR0369310.1 hypothetical protein [Methanobrevibacter sp.]
MKYDFNLDEKSTIESLTILINQCWKTLPIFEGKNKNGEIAYSRDEAYENYQKHLLFLSTKLLGASELWKDNQYYVELVYMIEGMKKFNADEHDRVKYIVNHCTNLINSMKDEVTKNVDEVLQG